MLQIEWTQPALADFIEIETFIEKENPEAAYAVAQHVWNASKSLRDHPLKGREGHFEDTREWVVNKTPCILVYRVQSDRIEILHVHHERQNWKDY